MLDHMCICRDEQYRILWGEIETLSRAYSTNSERHLILLEFILKVIANSPSTQQARKAPQTKSGILLRGMLAVASLGLSPCK